MRIFRNLFFGVLCVFLTVLTTAAQQFALEAGKLYQSQIIDGKPAVYSFSLKKGEFLRVVLEQRGVDLTLRVIDGQAQVLAETNQNKTLQGVEQLAFIAETGGNFQLVITPSGKNSRAAGNYSLIQKTVFTASEAAKWANYHRDNASYYAEQNKAELAYFHREQELKIRTATEPNSADTAHAHYYQGVYLSANDQNRALSELTRARDIYAALKLADDENVTEYYLGWVQVMAGRYSAALPHLQKAAKYAAATNNKTLQIEVEQTLGDVLLEMGDNAGAQKLYERILPISLELKNREREATALLGLAGVLFDYSKHEESLKKIEESLKIVEQLKNQQLKAAVYNLTGANYCEMGLYDKSLENYEKARVLYAQGKNDYGVNTIINNQAFVYLRIGSLEKGRQMFESYLKTEPQTNDSKLRGMANASLGAVLARLKLYDEAIIYFEKSLPQLQVTKFDRMTIITKNIYGGVRRERGEIAQAVKLHTEAVEFARKIKAQKVEAWAMNELGLDYLEQKRFADAEREFQRALILAGQINSRDEIAGALDGLMRAANLRGNRNLAIFYGKQSINLLQKTRGDIQKIDRQMQVDFVKDNEKTYRQLAQILIAAGRFAEAEEVLDLLKQEEYFNYSRRAADEKPNKNTVLNAAEAKAEAGFAQQAASVTAIGKKYDEINSKIERTPAEEKLLNDYQLELDAATAKYQTFLTKLIEQLPNETASGEQKTRVEGAESLMDTLRELGEITGQKNKIAAVYTLVGEKELSLMVVTPKTRVAETIKISSVELNQLISEFRLALKNENCNVQEISARLYAKIFAPIEKHIAPLRDRDDEILTLMWSLDGALRYIPIAALYDAKRGKYLVESYRNTLFTAKSSNKLERKPRAKWNALGLGVSEKRTENGIGFNALPAVISELSMIGDAGNSLLGGKVLRDKDFTLAAMQTELRRERPLVHIASHFHFAPTNDGESFLLLGEGKLTVADMKQNKSQIFAGVELLTLSACNTGLGAKNETGKEIDGFGAFAQDKGAQSVIAALWAIEDGSTADLMQKFYGLKNTDTSLTKAEALRRAQVALLKGEVSRKIDNTDRGSLTFGGTKACTKFSAPENARFAHPYHWSPFILYGNWL